MVLDGPLAFGRPLVMDREVFSQSGIGFVLHLRTVLEKAIAEVSDWLVVNHLCSFTGAFDIHWRASTKDELVFPVVCVVDGDVPVDSIAERPGPISLHVAGERGQARKHKLDR